MVLCGLRFDAAEKLLARSLRGRLRLVVFHLSLALAALAVGRQNALATRGAPRRGSAPAECPAIKRRWSASRLVEGANDNPVPTCSLSDFTPPPYELTRTSNARAGHRSLPADCERRERQRKKKNDEAQPSPEAAREEFFRGVEPAVRRRPVAWPGRSSSVRAV